MPIVHSYINKGRRIRRIKTVWLSGISTPNFFPFHLFSSSIDSRQPNFLGCTSNVHTISFPKILISDLPFWFFPRRAKLVFGGFWGPAGFPVIITACLLYNNVLWFPNDFVGKKLPVAYASKMKPLW